MAGEAWTNQIPRFELQPVAEGWELSAPQYHGLLRRLPPDLAWSLRVPMSTASGKPFLVVLVDGSDILQDTEPTREVIEALIDRIEAIYRPVVKQFEETQSRG